MDKRLILAICTGALALILIGVGAEIAHQRIPKLFEQEGGPKGILIRDDDLVREGNFYAGYMLENDKAFYVTKTTFVTEDPNVDGFRYDKYEIEGADSKSFVVLDETGEYPPFHFTWAVDDQNIYHDGTPIAPLDADTPAIDRESLEIIDYRFIKDKNAVFVVDFLSEDGNYFLYQKLPLDPETVIFIGTRCVMDKNGYYSYYYGSDLERIPAITSEACRAYSHSMGD